METSQMITMAPALVMKAPLLFVWLAGIGLAVVFRERHPTASTLAIVAFLMMFINALVGVYVSGLPIAWMEQGLPTNEIGVRLVIVNGARTFASVAAWALLLVAMFKRRP